LKKILIISPHFPPSNLAAVHRSRLFAQHLPSMGWEPTVLMVDEKYYEEKLDHNLEKLVPANLKIEKASAFGVTKPRLIGDIGMRGFFQLYKKAKQIVRRDKIDFVYIPIPSFYVALLGRWLHASTGVKYGIDYIDPWVHEFPGAGWRYRLSETVAKFLEPIAVKKASLITGVAEGYYKGVHERNPNLLQSCVFAAMPYGGEREDHAKVAQMDIKPYLFAKSANTQLVYAGAMLPKAYEPLEAIFKAISAQKGKYQNIEFHFIGTGKTPNDPQGFNIKPLAEKYGLWQSVVFEYPARIPYMDVLVHLDAADGIFILGSTEPHYTPSKVYQAVLSSKAILAVLHGESTAFNVVNSTKAGIAYPIVPENIEKITTDFNPLMDNYLQFMQQFQPSQVDTKAFDQYSAKAVTQILANSLNKICG
jgi:hypothetical protein